MGCALTGRAGITAGAENVVVAGVQLVAGAQLVEQVIRSWMS